MQNLAQQTIQQTAIDQTAASSINDESISFIQEIPDYLKDAISAFIDKHPNWDQYRLLQAAISGYLLDKGVYSREINRLYFKTMFCKKTFGQRL